MKSFAILVLISALGVGKLSAQTAFDYEANKNMLIERFLMQYFVILHGDNFDVSHLDDFCADRAKGADLAALREIARNVPEEFTWTNKGSGAIAKTPFKPGSIYTVEVQCTDGRTAVAQLVVTGNVEQPYLVVHDHLRFKN
jgi:hypothetical protein